MLADLWVGAPHVWNTQLGFLLGEAWGSPPAHHQLTTTVGSRANAHMCHLYLRSVCTTLFLSGRRHQLGSCPPCSPPYFQAEGGIDWVGVPASAECKALFAAAAAAEAAAEMSSSKEIFSEEIFSVPIAVLRAHLQVMRESRSRVTLRPPHVADTSPLLTRRS